MELSAFVIEDIVRTALKEDLGQGYDSTSEALIPSDREGRLAMVAREDGVLAGAGLAYAAFSTYDPTLEINVLKHDGTQIKAGDTIVTVKGLARSILTAERTALNFMSHMSGIASETARYVAATAGTNASITCTRKTLPGLRIIQKYAVRVGGGVNHRYGLGDGILIKDNHIALAGGVREAITQARKHAGHMLKIEIEVDTLEQLEDVLAIGADVIMLDNMGPDMLKKAVAMIDGQALAEASGGITLETVGAVAKSGVDLISVGALTHSVTALDIGLDIDV